MRAQTWSWLFVAVTLLSACTKDFSRFQFRDLPPTVKPETAGSSGNTSNAGREAALGRNQIGGASGKPWAGASGSQTAGRGGSPRVDGGAGKTANGGASASQAGAGRMALADEDAGMHPDAQMPLDASQPPRDAGPSAEQQCTSSASRELKDFTSGCTSCACRDCAPSVLPCLEQGDTVYDRPCRDLLKCAVHHGCHDWDCYCSTQSCRTNSEDEGDGPCFEEMNAAAGDSHNRAAVNAAHSDKEPSNPMTMALKATTCMLGSEHGSVAGACETACDVR